MIGDIFYNLFITPIELIFEVIFWFLRAYPALAIVAISIVMNFLALPLYRRADAIHAEERDKVASMADRVARIKKSFRGDERYMVLTTYYREQHYKPIYALRSTFSLLLQVPFFIAAYHFLSQPGLLDGSSFWFLQDLGAPDQLLTIGGISINLMPILMTLINVVSSYIYLRGFSLRDKIQTYGIAVVFLVLLYNSPSGLVFYWTLNQIFSVLKNIFMRLVTSRKVLNLFFVCVGVLVFAGLLLSGLAGSPKRVLFAVLILLLCFMPAFLSWIRKKREGKPSGTLAEPSSARYFLLGGCFLTLLVGIVIPMSVISSSPTEFSNQATSAARIVISTACVTAGYFLIWLGIYYYMSRNTVRNLFIYAVWILSGVFAVDFMLFSKNLGVMSTFLVFDRFPEYTRSEKLLNLLVVAAVIAGFILLMKLRKKWVGYIYLILIAGFVLLSGWRMVSSARQIREFHENAGQSASASASEDFVVSDTIEPIIPLSRNGRNVVLLMMDRAISGYLPYIFQEKPELQDQFAGFTYYPNTVSYGGHTNFGTPAIFGGYEYTPAAMNQRDQEPIAQKHQEALLLMPTLFAEEGYEVTVCDPPYAGYHSYFPDITLYQDMEGVNAYITYGAYAQDLLREFGTGIQDRQNHNFFFYSLMRSVPTLFQNTVYNQGNYYTVGGSANVFSSSDEFLYSYSVLYNLPQLTRVLDTDQNTFLSLDNDTTHSNTILQTPEYEPATVVTSDTYGDMERFTLNGVTIPMDTEYRMGHYHANMAAFLQLGKWMDYLREMGVYDNTRIIIVSDHGNGLGQFEDLLVADDWDAEWVNSLLLYKDFGEQEFRSSQEFMTTADVPALAMQGLISDPKNPFTGKPVTAEVDKENQLVTSSHNWDIFTNNGTVYDTSDGSWWKVHGNVHDPGSWERVE